MWKRLQKNNKQMNKLYLCDGTVPKCCRSFGCGPNFDDGPCFHTTNRDHALLKRNDEERNFEMVSDDILMERKPKAVVKPGRLPDAPKPTLPVTIGGYTWIRRPLVDETTGKVL